MREIRSSGSVEGVMRNHDPYSDLKEVILQLSNSVMLRAKCHQINRRAWTKPLRGTR
jgi:hypothetical protein